MQFVSKAEAPIQSEVESALERSHGKQVEHSSNCDEALQLMQAFKETTERGLQQHIKDVVCSQRQAIILATGDLLEIVLHEQTKLALVDVQTLAIETSRRQLFTIERRLKDIEQRLLAQLHPEVSAVSTRQDGCAQWLVEATLVQAIQRIQAQIENRIRSVRGELLLVANGSAQKHSGALATDCDARFRSTTTDKDAAVNVELPAEQDATWINKMIK